MNKPQITLEDLFNLEGAVIYNPDSCKPLTAVSTDSRNIPSSAIFAALKGENFDGHLFLKDAVKNGAKALLVNQDSASLTEKFNITAVAVPDTVKALGELANAWRHKLNTKIIALTGSAGKTSTKEILAQLLSVKYKVNKTVANHNNHLGVPLTLFSTNAKHDFLVCELGTNHFGEIAYTAKIAEPDYALITNIGSSHLEYLKNRSGVLKEKAALLDVTAKRKGVVFINNDDKLLNKYGSSLKKKVTYGFENDADIVGILKGLDEEGRPEVAVFMKDTMYTYRLPLHGVSSALNFLAAAAVALTVGMSHEEIAKGVRKLKAYDKRLNIRKYNSTLVIDDTYNANPESMTSSINLLGSMSLHENKIAVLGDMFELGKDAEKHHASLASVIKKNKLNEVYLTGKSMKSLAAALKESKVKVRHFAKAESLADFLSKKDFSNSVVLVKGSRGMKMEQFVKVIEGVLE